MTPLIYTNCHRIMGGIYAGWRSEFGKVTAKFRTTGLPRKRPTQRDLKFKSDKRNGTIGDHVEAVPDMTTYDLLSFSRCLKIFETVLRKRACRWISASGFLLEVYVLLIYHSI